MAAEHVANMEDLYGTGTVSIFCWNIQNPSEQRAGKQAEWLRKRPENVLVLTETKRSEGCMLLEKYFQAFGYKVFTRWPENGEYGVMIVSKLAMKISSPSKSIDFLPSRLVAVTAPLLPNELEIIGVYVPSRDSSDEKIRKKKTFLQQLTAIVNQRSPQKPRVFCGDLNILEPDHVPYYPFFEQWEYDFYRSLTQGGMVDAFRHLNPNTQEYSWVGRTGDGYRYDHCFVSSELAPLLRKTFYLHEPREQKLSDHSALIIVMGSQ